MFDLIIVVIFTYYLIYNKCKDCTNTFNILEVISTTYQSLVKILFFYEKLKHKMFVSINNCFVWYSTNFKLKKPGIRAVHVTQKHTTVYQNSHPDHKHKHHNMLIIRHSSPVVPSEMDTSIVLLSISLWADLFSQ